MQQPKHKSNKPIDRSSHLPKVRMNNTVRLLALSILFVGLSGFILLFGITGALNGWWGIPWISYDQ